MFSYSYLGVTSLVCCFLLFPLSAATPSAEEKKWEEQYPKLNSKMARMEELLNYIDRFIGDQEFKKQMLKRITELTYHTESSKKKLPDYLKEESKKPFIEALQKTKILSEQLYKSVESDDWKKAKMIFLDLDKLRRSSHSKWAM